MPKSHLTLIGAGPGDPELITLKAIKALKNAEVVLYDALVNPQIIDFAPKNISSIYVGKRCGKHSLRQIEINQLIVNLSKKYKYIVRLKGGDPMIFGRGLEEILYAHKYGISTSVIPGISSAIAAPISANIPLTHRGCSNSFWVLTATTAQHQLSSDLTLAAQSQATLVILMGTRKLKEITEIMSLYRSKDTGIALIHKATIPSSQVQIHTLEKIAKHFDQIEFKAPGIIVVGEVVKFGLMDMAPWLEKTIDHAKYPVENLDFQAFHDVMKL